MVYQGSTYYRTILRRDPCAICGEKVEPKALRTIDHIVPRSRGGHNSWSNFAAMCNSCNSRKGSLTLLDFLLLNQQGTRIKRKQLRTRRAKKLADKHAELNAMPDRWFDPLGVLATRRKHNGSRF